MIMVTKCTILLEVKKNNYLGQVQNRVSLLHFCVVSIPHINAALFIAKGMICFLAKYYRPLDNDDHNLPVVLKISINFSIVSDT